MAAPIILPDLGAGETPVRISGWLVEPGEQVIQGDRVVEVVLPGLTFDVPAPLSGRLVRIEKGLSSPVQPGEVLGWIESGT